MIKLGLTGSIGMGKSETLKMFQGFGLPIYDADAVVHRLYDKGGEAVALVQEAFPGVEKEGRIDRALLSKQVLGNPEALKKLESIVHPLVVKDRGEAILKAETDGANIMVFDVPLLFENGLEAEMDRVVVVSAPYEIQRARVLERPGMSAEKFDHILSQQMSDAEKRKRADFIVETDKGLDAARAQVEQIIAQLIKKA